MNLTVVEQQSSFHIEMNELLDTLRMCADVCVCVCVHRCVSEHAVAPLHSKFPDLFSFPLESKIFRNT